MYSVIPAYTGIQNNPINMSHTVATDENEWISRKE